LDPFKGIAQVEAGMGDTILFWSDMWNGQVLQQTYPQLHYFAINDKITLASVMQQDNLHYIFQLPLSEEAYLQYSDLEVMVQSLDTTDVKDKWKYIWGNTHYSSMKAYKYLSGS
jgi:hypothetical protein